MGVMKRLLIEKQEQERKMGYPDADLTEADCMAAEMERLALEFEEEEMDRQMLEGH